MKPVFRPGPNMAVKVPPHEYGATLSFYRDTLGLTEVSGDTESTTETARFRFGDKTLWIDRVERISQAEIWLEIVTDDLEAAADHLARHGVARRDGIEPLPDAVHGFWISSPSNIIHLVQALPSTGGDEVTSAYECTD